MPTTVLIIDDNDLDVERIVRGLRKLNASVATHRALDGRDGLAMLQELSNSEANHRIAILLDLNMPRMNGFEFLEIIRSDDSFRETSVTVLTTSDRPKDLEQAQQLGARGYLVKPVKKEQLADLLSSLEADSELAGDMTP